MKVILYQDVKHLGEMGDEKNVANGYARNYLFPRMLAVPYNDETIAFFATKKEEIAARKEQKRADSASLKEKLEAFSVEFTMPAGTNGKLYGAVTSQTITDYLSKNGFDIERKRIEIPGLTIKSTGNYHAVIHLYETQTAEVKISVKGQVSEKAAAKAAAGETKSRKAAKAEESSAAEVSESKAEEAPVEKAE
jgi:large subunit ribosomal protein L9